VQVLHHHLAGTHMPLGFGYRLRVTRCRHSRQRTLPPFVCVQVSVPCSSLLKMVAVQCGRCAGLLSVSVPSPPPPPPSVELHLQVSGPFLPGRKAWFINWFLIFSFNSTYINQSSGGWNRS
jgi:hypothetical protein